MIETFEIAFPGGASAPAVRIEQPGELGEAARTLALRGSSASIVLIGGADGMPARDLAQLGPLFSDVLAELAFRLRAAVLDGGTDTGVMRLMGRARQESSRDFPLVGVIAARLAALPGRPALPGAAQLEPNHTHFVLVPGDDWGDEGPWLMHLGEMIGGGRRTVTLLVNGGDISQRDAERSVDAGRPVVALAGSGRAADALADAAAGRPPDEASERIAATGLVRVVDARDRSGLAWTLEDVLSGAA